MATLQATGLGSNLDVASIVSQLMSIERQPVTNLTKVEQQHQAKLSAYGQIKSGLSTLADAANALVGSSSKFKALKVSSSDDATLTASASGVAPGSYAIKVNQLAQQHKLASSALSSSTAEVGTGTLTIDFGTESGGAFTANSALDSISVTIDSSNNTLEGLRDAINDAGGNVRASIINDGTGARLALSAIGGGSGGAMRIQVSGDSDGSDTNASGLSRFAYDIGAAVGSGKNLEEKAAARSALLEIDGISVQSASNQVSDVISGVTLNLKKTTAIDASVTVDLAQDTAGAKAGIEAFLNAYNAINSQIRSQSAYDAATKTAGKLQGEGSVRSIGAQLRNLAVSSVDGLTGYTRLSDIGISMQKDGSLKLDNTKFEAAYEKNPSAVEKLFSQKTSDGTPEASQGLAVQFKSLADKLTAADGLLAARTEGINTQIKNLGKRRDAMNDRLEQVEARLRRQFIALDASVSKMNSTSAYLTQQLENL